MSVVAAFTSNPSFTTCGRGGTITFFDTSTGSPTSWAWDFGDPASGGSNTSTLKNPTHIFDAANNYTVQLTATGSNSSNVSHTITVSDVGVSPEPGAINQTINFTAPSGGTNWVWNFGDPGSGGANTSSLQNPTHSFAAAGTYSVRLDMTRGS
jgi:PKD repeat protein